VNIQKSKNHLFSHVLIGVIIVLLSVPGLVLTSQGTFTQDNFSVEIDGEITQGEYQNKIQLGDQFDLSWSIDNEIIFFGIIAETNGWLAIGFEPSTLMNNADMIFSWVESNGSTITLDCYSTGKYGPHPPDIDLGGTNDILESNGSETIKTTIEFSRKLKTGDIFDKEILLNQSMNVIWAFGDTDDFLDKHSSIGSVVIDFARGESIVNLPFWFYHALLIALGFLMILSGILIAHYRVGQNWLKKHKFLNISGVLLILIAIISNILQIDLIYGRHLRILHSYLGLISALTLFTIPILGYSIFKVNKQRVKQFRLIHRWLGRTALTLVLVTALMGILKVIL